MLLSFKGKKTTKTSPGKPPPIAPLYENGK